MSDLDFHTTDSEQPFRVAEVGDGHPIVFLHGFPDTPQSWQSTASLVASKGYRAVVPYLRGYHVDTIVPGRSYEHDEAGADVIALLDALDIDRATLVGHDWGASSVWSAVDQAPERVARIVPIAIPHPDTLKPSPKLLWGVRHFGVLKLPGATKRLLRKDLQYINALYQRWAPSWQGADQADTLARARTTLTEEAVLDQAIEWYRDLSFSRPPAEARTYDVPGLLVAGDEDFDGNLAPYEASIKLLAPASRLMVAEGAGHWPHRERQEQFHDELLRFLGDTEV